MVRRLAQLLAVMAMLASVVTAQCTFTCGLEALQAARHACCPADQTHAPNPQPCPDATVLPGTTSVALDLATFAQLATAPAPLVLTHPQVTSSKFRSQIAELTHARTSTSFAILRI